MVAINPASDNDQPPIGVDLSCPPWPPRSPLVSLRPIGLGTGMVESLWGYLVRLSAAHAVGLRDMWRLVAPAAGIVVAPTLYLSLKGERAARLAATIERLTIRTDIRQITLVAVEHNTGIVIKTCDNRAWCDMCLDTDEEPYDRQLWNIGLVGCCSIHGRPLRRRCPACGYPQLLSAMGSRIARCARCRAPLAKNDQLSVSSPTQYDLWISREIAAFIAHFASHASDNGAITANLKATVQICGGIRPLARLLRATPNTVRSWLRGTYGMALESVLRCAWLTSLPAVDLLSREVTVSEISLREAAAPKRGTAHRKQKRLTPEDYTTALGQFLQERPFEVPACTAISRILGGSRKVQATRAPHVREAIAIARHERQVAIKKARIWHMVCDVYRAVSWLNKGARPITSRNITAYLGIALMKRPLARHYYFNLQQQLKAGRSPSNPIDRLPQDVQAFWKHCDLI